VARALQGRRGISISDLGETDSVPAFTYRQTVDQNDYRVVMASGYPYPSAAAPPQLVEATAWAGDTPSTTAGATISGSDNCTGTTGQEFAVLADVAVARDYTKNGNQNMLAGYAADTWGTVHQYAPAYSPVLHDIITRLSASAALLPRGGAAQPQRPEPDRRHQHLSRASQ